MPTCFDKAHQDHVTKSQGRLHDTLIQSIIYMAAKLCYVQNKIKNISDNMPSVLQHFTTHDNNRLPRPAIQVIQYTEICLQWLSKDMSLRHLNTKSAKYQGNIYIYYLTYHYIIST